MLKEKARYVYVTVICEHYHYVYALFVYLKFVDVVYLRGFYYYYLFI